LRVALSRKHSPTRKETRFDRAELLRDIFMPTTGRERSPPSCGECVWDL